MGILDLLRRSEPAPTSHGGEIIHADAGGEHFDSLRDPRLAPFVRGSGSASGMVVTERTALRNTTVFRSVSLISYAIGMLPLHLIRSETKEKATDHPLFNLLHREPNSFQSAFDFRMLMQMRVLTGGNAYALAIRSRGRIIALVPLRPERVTPVQGDDWSVKYEYRAPGKQKQEFSANEILHLRGLTPTDGDGIEGMSLVKQAQDAIGLALAADLAIGRVFKNGSFVDGTLNAPRDLKLSDESRKNLKTSWAERYGGAGNAGKTPLLEDGIEYKLTGSTAKDAQSNETRARQVEEIARIFGVPRPLLMVDETSWGSGIDVLGQFFVRYGLNPWFEAWQQAIRRTLLTDAEKDRYEVKFNAGGLLRGSMTAQGDFFSKGLGSGGQQPWMTPNEVRDVLDMPAHADGDSLVNPMTAPPTTTEEENDAAA